VIPVITPARMAEIDAAATEPFDVLIERAGRGVARVAIEMLGGTYGRRVIVIVGPGNNGADGRVAARQLARRGVRCSVVEVANQPASIDQADLVIDAAFGNGLRRSYEAPIVAGHIPVLAVDLPSGVDGHTGAAFGRPLRADRTVTFVALKPGLVLEPGRSLGGLVEVIDIGLAASGAVAFAVNEADIAPLLPTLPVDDHKWRTGLRIVGGSPGMTGAAWLAARAAQRCGAGIVQLAMPGARGDEGPTEAVAHPLPLDDWAAAAFDQLPARIGAVLVGPGLGLTPSAALKAACALPVPLVLDGDALQRELVPLLAERDTPTVLTPHDGEWRRLTGGVADDRIADTVSFAEEHGVTVVRKGPTTIVAGPDAPTRVITSGTAALATAGTGDVLAGAIVAFLAQGVSGPDAGVIAAHLHGRAGAELGPGLVASEVADALAALLPVIAAPE